MQIPGNDPSRKLHALFPTLVFRAHLRDADKWSAALKDVLPIHGFSPESGDGGKHFAGEYHGQILLHQDRSLRPFFETVTVEISEYLTALGMNSGFFNVQFLKTWFVLCEPRDEEQDALLPHNHSASDISWVYYVDVPDDAPAIKFHTTGRPNTAPFESAFHYDWHNDEKSAIDTCNWWNSDSWSVHPKSGDLLIFPGHQLHSVDSNHTSQVRISVAGDVALTLKEEFTNLEFGRTAPEHWLTLPFPAETRSDHDRGS